MYGAGALVWRRKNKKIEVLIVHRPHWRDWSFPKGKCKGGENLRNCCLREVWEEGRVQIVLGVPLGWQRYRMNSGRWKAVHYWAAQVLSADSPAAQLRRRQKFSLAPKSEIDKIRWASLAQAERMLSAERDKKMLKQLQKLAAAGDLDTQPVVVVRHVKAVKREKWADKKGAEKSRPLTAAGKAQRVEVAQVLSAYGVRQVFTSPWKRCYDTVLPYAEASGIALQERRNLTEKSFRNAPEKFGKDIESLLLAAGMPRAVCVHRPTLGEIIRIFRKYAVVQVAAKLPAKDPWLHPGEVLIAHTVAKKKAALAIVQIEVVHNSQSAE